MTVESNGANSKPKTSAYAKWARIPDTFLVRTYENIHLLRFYVYGNNFNSDVYQKGFIISSFNSVSDS